MRNGEVQAKSGEPMPGLYKGYIFAKGKKAQEPFSESANPHYKTLIQVQQSGKDYAGVLNSKTVLIDFDDPEDAKIFLKLCSEQKLPCRVLKTTRGLHALFFDDTYSSCATGATLAIGLRADIKTGQKNCYEALRVDGVDREIIYDAKEYGTAPRWLHPIKGCPDFSTMGNGDGRNQALFTYILTLMGEGFSEQEARETIQLINDNVIPEPLPKREIETILRKEAFPADLYYKHGAFQHDAFGNYLISKYHVQRINGRVCFCFDGIFSPDEALIRAAMTKEMPKLKQTQKRETLEYIRDTVSFVNQSESGAQYIAFSNGVYNLDTGALEPLSPLIRATSRVPHKYAVDAYCAPVDDALNAWACNDPAIRALLEEMIGYCLYRRNDFQKAFVLVGKKSNGKSTFLELVKFALGEQNYSQLDIADLDDRFATASLYGKMANIGDDIGDDFLQGRSVATFKKIVTGNGLSADVKYESRIEFKPYCKLIFSANTIPRMKDHTGAVVRRMLIIPFNATFSKGCTGYQPKMEWRLKNEESAEYLLRLGIEGLHRLFENGGFTESAKVDEQIASYELENDPIRQFLKEHDDEWIYREPLPTIHRAYNVFCADNGFRQCSSRRLASDIKDITGANSERRRVNGKLDTFFCK